MKKVFDEKKNQVVLRTDNLKAEFLPSGDLYRLGTDSRMINQVLSNPIDGSLNNIYLRVFQENDEIKFTPLLGVHSPSVFYSGDRQVKWTGQFEGISYDVLFTLTEENIWFWQVILDGEDKEVDLIYGQDVGLAEQNALQKNEAYIAQYIDHKVLDEDNNGYTVGSRQNQPQSNNQHPYLQQGALNKVIGFSTDGLQFYGTSYKETNNPESLSKEMLSNHIYQYEFAYTALQSEKILLNNETEFIFYGLYRDNHEEAITELVPVDKIAQVWNKVEEEKIFKEEASQKIHSNIGDILVGEDLAQEEIEKLYPKRIQEEINDQHMYSFFTPEYNHIVIKEKEKNMERPHGHILFTGDHLTVNNDTLSTTNWMYGIFNAHTVVGNTDQNKWISNTRNPLNIFKTTGQRIYVKLDNKYRLLGMPSIYEIGVNHTKWIYVTKYDTFFINAVASANHPEIKLELNTKSGKEYEYMITNQVVLNPDEYIYPFYFEKNENILSFYSDDSTLNKKEYPHLRYDLKLNGASFEIKNEQALVEGVNSGSASLIVMNVEKTNHFELIMQSHLDGGKFVETGIDLEIEIKKFRKQFSEITNNFQLSTENEIPSKLEKMNITVWWYTHNMFIHYLMPHGLEQYSGAAWGTRDVSQGPSEYFLAMQNYDVVKDILMTIYSHQNYEDGNWPQWFMFDNYSNIQADESHGDVIVWPLKILSDYLVASGDLSILEVELPYISKKSKEQTKEQETIFDHIRKQFDYIESNFIEETYLSKYGDGDWNDSLQPHDENLRKYMVSSWTVTLTYQALSGFSKAIEKKYPEKSKEAFVLADNIKKDYQKYILSDEVVPGLVYMESIDNVTFFLHPSDNKTGIEYRMLPMIRGIISEIFENDEARKHHEIIEKELHFPDGAHLMNRPATYKGGVSTNFKRAEQAAFLGREIGLNYIHANIRYIEAMAKLGEADAAWKELEVINPINNHDIVPNSVIRQNNAYFSSSDADFNTRYEAQENYNQLKEGQVPVKGGWRIYSSGPGIYLNQLISNVLGIRQENEDLIIDPVLPPSYDGIILDFVYRGVPIKYEYHYSEEPVDYITVNGTKVKGQRKDNPYRTGALKVNKDEITNHLGEKTGTIKVYFNN